MAREMRTLALWLLLCLLVILFTATKVVSKTPKRIPRLRVHPGLGVHKGRYRKNPASASPISDLLELQTYYYNQTLDHFNYQPPSFQTFQQRFMMSFKYWRGANASAPILVYLGEESALDGDLDVIGFLPENAARFDALLVYMEHRFYGKSVPFVTQQEALKNATLRGYFNSAQALADYAELILHIKKSLSAENSPVIVVGGSYGGMLAAYFRLKYPHIALGALASSAPLLYFDNIIPPDSYLVRASEDFKEASVNCYKTIKESWSVIDKTAAAKDGLAIISKKFKTCKPVKDVSDLKVYLQTLYQVLAQYDTPVPSYPVENFCKGVDRAPKGVDILDKIFSGVVAYFGKRPCYDTEEFFPKQTLDGWAWQVCSDLVITMGLGVDEANATMFEPQPFDLKATVDDCTKQFGVPPRPHWLTTNFGGHKIKEVLRRFGSNIIFSNGHRDPYSTAGVLEDINDSVLAIYTPKGSHCLDLLFSTMYDPDWLVSQRNKEVEIISGWLLKHYEDLLEDS